MSCARSRHGRVGRPFVGARSRLAAVVLVAAAGLSGCRDRASHCDDSVSREECRACCTKAGRPGSTWAMDDCVCHED